MFYYWRMFWKIFRDTSSNYYGLDTAYDCTWPNFAFDAMLKLRPSFLLYPISFLQLMLCLSLPVLK